MQDKESHAACFPPNLQAALTRNLGAEIHCRICIRRCECEYILYICWQLCHSHKTMREVLRKPQSQKGQLSERAPIFARVQECRRLRQENQGLERDVVDLARSGIQLVDCIRNMLHATAPCQLLQRERCLCSPTCFTYVVGVHAIRQD